KHASLDRTGRAEPDLLEERPLPAPPLSEDDVQPVIALFLHVPGMRRLDHEIKSGIRNQLRAQDEPELARPIGRAGEIAQGFETALLLEKDRGPDLDRGCREGLASYRVRDPAVEFEGALCRWRFRPGRLDE